MRLPKEVSQRSYDAAVKKLNNGKEMTNKDWLAIETSRLREAIINGDATAVEHYTTSINNMGLSGEVEWTGNSIGFSYTDEDDEIGLVGGCCGVCHWDYMTVGQLEKALIWGYIALKWDEVQHLSYWDIRDKAIETAAKIEDIAKGTYDNE